MQSTIERLSLEAFTQVENEVGALIGTDIEISLLSASLIKKQEYLENLSGRNSIICLHMGGRYEGEGCLVIAEDCAVRLAGKMLMLPSMELNEIIGTGTYADEEELNYAFDDIAKCLVITYLDSFQRSSNFIATVTCHSQRFAEGRKETGDVLEHLSSDQTYYQVSGTITLAGVTTNTISLLLPAFVLVCSEPFRKHTGQQITASAPPSEIHNQEPTISIEKEAPVAVRENGDDLFMVHLRPLLQKELSNMLGITVQVRDKGSFSGPLKELLQDTDTGPRRCTRINISGDVHSHGWLIAATSDAMKLGLLLTEGTPGLMLPGSLSGDFSVDCQDGFQEICSILTDVVDHVCHDWSDDEFVIERGEIGNEADVIPDSTDQISVENPMYCRLSFELVADTLVCGTMHMVLPMEIYKSIRSLESESSPEMDVNGEQQIMTEQQPADQPIGADQGQLSDQRAMVMLIEESADHLQEITRVIEEAGIKIDNYSLADDLSEAGLDTYLAVLLVLDRMDEIGLGAVIKIKSTSSVPLLVAASQWTQTDVMKALRYGVDDIVMLPAESDELLRKLRRKEPLSA